MTQEEIKLFIEKYESFVELVCDTKVKLQKVNYFRWFTHGYFSNLTIEDGLVILTYYHGHIEDNSVQFPASWLLLSDEDLIMTATIDDKIKTEEEQRIKLEREEAAQKSREDREREEYLKLKAKFES